MRISRKILIGFILVFLLIIGIILVWVVSSNHRSTASMVLNKPDEVKNGDMLIAEVSYLGGENVTVTPPSSDWHQILKTDNEILIGQDTYYKFITDAASEPLSYTFLLSGKQSTLPADGCILRYSGVNADHPVVASSGNVGDGTSLQTNSAKAEDRTMIISLFSINQSDIVFTKSADMSSMTNWVDSNNQNGLGIYVADQFSNMGITGNRTLYADQGGPWTAQLVVLQMEPYTITYQSGSHGTLTSEHVNQATEVVMYGQQPAAVPGVSAASNYTFTGWYLDGDTTLLTSAEVAALKITTDVTFIAQYKYKHVSKTSTRTPYSITFDLASLGTSPDLLTFNPVYSGDTITIPTVTANPGWSFDGWDVTPSTTVTGSATYTAQYTHIPYSVTFDLAGMGTSGDQLVFDPVYYGDTITIPTVTANPGWLFDRWDVTPSTTVEGTAVYTALYRISRDK